MQTILLANPRGFCAGVERAIAIVEQALQKFGAPIYVRHEVVHNRFVVDDLKAKGAIFIEDLADVPAGATLIFSAHGVSQAVREEAAARGFKLFDATCPLVTKVHLEAVKFARKGYTIVLIGHENHDEVVGTLGEAPDAMVLVQTVEDVDRLTVPEETKMAYLTQTTLSLDETSDIVVRLRERFPHIEGPHSQDICYATENRQVAVKAVVPMTDLLLVVGSRNSSNSQRLVEVCRKEGRPAYLVDDENDVRAEWLDGVKTVSITAGASAPEHLVERLIEFLRANGFGTLETLEVKEEDVRFSLPPELNASRLTQISPSI